MKLLNPKNNHRWASESLRLINNKIKIEESLYIGNGDYPVSTKQIILFGTSNKIKNIVEWNLNKVN